MEAKTCVESVRCRPRVLSHLRSRHSSISLSKSTASAGPSSSRVRNSDKTESSKPGELKTSHQGQSPGGFGWPPVRGKERSKIGVFVKRSQLVAKSNPRGAFAFAKGGASHARGFFWDRWNRSSFK